MGNDYQGLRLASKGFPLSVNPKIAEELYKVFTENITQSNGMKMSKDKKIDGC